MVSAKVVVSGDGIPALVLPRTSTIRAIALPVVTASMPIHIPIAQWLVVLAVWLLRRGSPSSKARNA